MRSVLVVIALLLAPNEGRSQPYDDPAVAICEYVHLAAEAPPSGYRRLDSTIDGLRVEVSFERSVLNTPPLQGKFGCVYRLTDAGYVFDFYLNDDERECAALMEEYLPVVRQGFRTAEDADRIMPEVYRCRPLLEAVALHESLVLTPTVQARVYATGIYPISADSTSLSSE